MKSKKVLEHAERLVFAGFKVQMTEGKTVCGCEMDLFISEKWIIVKMELEIKLEIELNLQNEK